MLRQVRGRMIFVGILRIETGADAEQKISRTSV